MKLTRGGVEKTFTEPLEKLASLCHITSFVFAVLIARHETD